MPTADQQESFLLAITDDAQPVVYSHLGLSHSVYITRLVEMSPYKFGGRDEQVFQLTMVATAAEASGASSAEQFLLSAGNDIEPSLYTDRNEEKHYVYITRLAQTMPYKFGGRYEPVYQVTMVDARAVLDVQGADGAKVSMLLATSVFDQVTAKWGTAKWGFSAWG